MGQPRKDVWGEVTGMDKKTVLKTKEILERLDMGGFWEPRNLGLMYIRTGERTVMLSSTSGPKGLATHRRMKGLIEAAGWVMDESDVVHFFHEKTWQELRELDRIQDEYGVSFMACSCGEPLRNSKGELGQWTLESITLTEENGCVVEHEHWEIQTPCIACDNMFSTSREEHLLLFPLARKRTRTARAMYRHLDPEDIVLCHELNLTDNISLLGTRCPRWGDRLPPHLHGTAVFIIPIQD